MRLRRRPQHIRKAERLIEDARFLIHHQSIGPGLLKARQAIDTLELALFEPPLTRLYSPELIARTGYLPPWEQPWSYARLVKSMGQRPP